MANEERLVAEIYDFLISQNHTDEDSAMKMSNLLNKNSKKPNLKHLGDTFTDEYKLMPLLQRHSNEFGITYDKKGIPNGVYADPAASHAEPRHAEPPRTEQAASRAVVPLSMFNRPSFDKDGSDPNPFTNHNSSHYNPVHMPYNPYSGPSSWKHPEHMPRGRPSPQRPSDLPYNPYTPHNPYEPGWYDDAMHPMHLRVSAPPGGNKKSRYNPNKAKKSRSKHTASKTKKRK